MGGAGISRVCENWAVKSFIPLFVIIGAAFPASALAASHPVSQAPKAGSLYVCGPTASVTKRFSPETTVLQRRFASDGGLLRFTGGGSARRVISNTLPPRSSFERIRGHRFVGTLPSAPLSQKRPICVNPDRPVGVTLAGEMIYPPAATAASPRSLSPQGECGGRTTSAGLYYLTDLFACKSQKAQLGWARDGAPIWINASHSAKLDACGGHVGRIKLDGEYVTRYHYHQRSSWPYTVGCFKNRPSTDWAVTLPDPGPASLKVEATPALVPAFDKDVTDYAMRCSGLQTVDLQIEAPFATPLAVNGGSEQDGVLNKQVHLAAGQRVMLAAGGKEYSLRCLPEDFPAYTAEITGPRQAAGYMVNVPSALVPSPNYMAIFDSNGVPVWWYETAGPTIDPKLLPNGNFAFSTKLGYGYSTDPSSHVEERTLSGALVREIRTVGSLTDFHEVQQTKAGNYLLISYPKRQHVDLTSIGGPSDATVLDAEIQEVSPSGDLLWRWNSNGHIALSETMPRWRGSIVDGTPQWDIIHLNSVEEAPDGNIVASARHLDAVFKIDKANGGIIWKLGGEGTFRSLAVSGTTRRQLGGNHDARVLADGTVTLHDNQSFIDGSAPRALRLSINESALTARVLEEVSDADEVPDSGCCGSARRLPGGNWVTEWGGWPLVSELRPDGSPVLRIRFSGAFSYRAYPVLPGEVPFSSLRSAMDSMSAVG